MKIIALIFSVAIAQLAGIIGSFFTSSSVRTWYVDIIKPQWNPPAWLFGPVWITLYTLMGVAAYLIWQQKDQPGAKIALVVYGIHLALNALWSIIFFGLKNPGLAFGEIIILLASILVVAFLFWRINPYAGMLFIPYVLWVSFASFLNYNIWKLN
ncbi:MAG: tryptophan-rich sensory protein [Candidatus Moranbacteria bacterium]|jgi:tryptophan-rich sensory protein|nr:tryptophan-rich sensory protein [Candidatus Moranbacteria bacterium]MDD5651781.1 tryptophan-rich sensory protein [Candidatus Moranbacteria bacterium]MDX9855653.1 TspO/MBR family protein [Candidatus Moranbacteria bacterium]